MASITQLEIQQALEISSKNNSKFIWLGRPTQVDIAKGLGVEKTKFLEIMPNKILSFNKNELEALKGSILVCYHGNTSMAVAKFLEEKGISTYNLKGGIAAVLGENSW